MIPSSSNKRENPFPTRFNKLPRTCVGSDWLGLGLVPEPAPEGVRPRT